MRHFSSSLQNAYSSEELNRLLYYQNSIFFQLQGGHWFSAMTLSDSKYITYVTFY